MKYNLNRLWALGSAVVAIPFVGLCQIVLTILMFLHVVSCALFLFILELLFTGLRSCDMCTCRLLITIRAVASNRIIPVSIEEYAEEILNQREEDTNEE